MSSVSNARPRDTASQSTSSSEWLVVAVAGLAVGVAVFYWQSTRPEKVCVATERHLVPIYAAGPKHHIKGPLTGYVDDQVCVKWEAKPAEPNEPFKWPAPVY
ncbi:hypothetical protein [Rhizobium sp. BK176]|uniref:hypothetical protein n=1 Tax=Rhizobium sp. BK176 TaxID=2587071 RepID=UPI00216720D8|nr:hypothetical protein [Rhizobium sp. BK176]MCS4088521.1 hypothetical protein [Rhizobium sp. BK176]